MYKLIAMDLDGTLLNSYGDVSEDNKNAIKQAINKGIEVVIASGRTLSSINSIAEEIGATNYIISGNGTLLYDVNNKKNLFESYIKKDKALKIIKICEENSIYYNIYTENEIIAKSLKYNTLYYNYENVKKVEEKQTKINIVQDIYKYIEENDKNIVKIMICDDTQSVFNRIKNRLSNISDISILETAHMSRKTIKSGTEDVEISYYYTEITNKNINKWITIERLIEHLGITKEEVMTIGDNVNDKEMVENAGLGVAMGKSWLEKYKIGDLFVADNNSSGVAEAIITEILQKY